MHFIVIIVQDTTGHVVWIISKIPICTQPPPLTKKENTQHSFQIIETLIIADDIELRPL